MSSSRLLVGADAPAQLEVRHTAGFALIGPFAAIGLYELSRRREAGLDTSSSHALDVLHSRSIGAILALGILLMLIFLVWVAVADAIYVANFGYNGPASVGKFVSDTFTTSAGWNVIVVGTIVGFLFADDQRHLLPLVARSRRRRCRRGSHLDPGRARQPGDDGAWGLIVAFLLVAGCLPFFLGLTVVMPVLGHATWHLYRKAVASEAAPSARRQEDEQPRPQRYAADFPASLFPTRR